MIDDDALHSVVVHSGSFTMRGGLGGWLLGVIFVRRAFEGLVARELERVEDAPVAPLT